MAPEALVAPVVLAQVLQHCVGTLLHLVGQEEQQLLVEQEAAVQGHLMVSAVQEGLPLPTAPTLLGVVVLVAPVVPLPAAHMKAVAVAADYWLVVMEVLVVVAEAALSLLAQSRVLTLLVVMEVVGQAPAVGAQLIQLHQLSTCPRMVQGQALTRF
jgi:hypothetical protein